MIYGIIFSHWIADFVLQTHKMATNKSKSNAWLGKHVLAYSLAMTPIAIIAGWNQPHWKWITFVLINGILHFYTDYFTSRRTSKLWAEGRVHDFFVVVGLDQALHLSALILSLELFK